MISLEKKYGGYLWLALLFYIIILSMLYIRIIQKWIYGEATFKYFADENMEKAFLNSFIITVAIGFTVIAVSIQSDIGLIVLLFVGYPIFKLLDSEEKGRKRKRRFTYDEDMDEFQEKEETEEKKEYIKKLIRKKSIVCANCGSTITDDNFLEFNKDFAIVKCHYCSSENIINILQRKTGIIEKYDGMEELVRMKRLVCRNCGSNITDDRHLEYSEEYISAACQYCGSENEFE